MFLAPILLSSTALTPTSYTITSSVATKYDTIIVTHH